MKLFFTILFQVLLIYLGAQETKKHFFSFEINGDYSRWPSTNVYQDNQKVNNDYYAHGLGAGLGFGYRYNIKEVSERISLSLNSGLTVRYSGYSVVFSNYSNYAESGETYGMFEFEIPLQAGFNAGLGALYDMNESNGFQMAIGPSFHIPTGKDIEHYYYLENTTFEVNPYLTVKGTVGYRWFDKAYHVRTFSIYGDLGPAKAKSFGGTLSFLIGY